MTDRSYTPALGRFGHANFYDPIMRLTRERRWRGLALRELDPQPGERIVDVGCGTGTLALLLHAAQPRAQVLGVDPDLQVLGIAARKARDAGPTLRWQQGMGDELVRLLGEGSMDKATSSLVLHQCPMQTKRAILQAMHGVLRPGGRLVIADYGWQRSLAMRLAFRVVQFADGKEDTQPNADGVLPELMRQAGFAKVLEAAVVPTITGSISVYVARRP